MVVGFVNPLIYIPVCGLLCVWDEIGEISKLRSKNLKHIFWDLPQTSLPLRNPAVGKWLSFCLDCGHGGLWFYSIYSLRQAPKTQPQPYHHRLRMQRVRSFWKQPNITFDTEPLLIKGNLSNSEAKAGSLSHAHLGHLFLLLLFGSSCFKVAVISSWLWLYSIRRCRHVCLGL